jgi:hypothetical protein
LAKAAREAYEQAVRDLRNVASELLADKQSAETVARTLVRLRNELKAAFRRSDPPEIVQAVERRNIAKYGDPLGPTADQQFQKYGDWGLVIDAACRPMSLSNRL